MTRWWKAQTEAVAQAWEASAQKQNTTEDGETVEIVSDTELTDVECTGWTGGINHVLSDSEDDEDSDWEDTDDKEIVIQIVMKILILKSWKAKIWWRAWRSIGSWSWSCKCSHNWHHMSFCWKRRNHSSGRMLKQSEDWDTMDYQIDGSMKSISSCMRRRTGTS